MSRPLYCDNCGAILQLNARGEHDGGEDAAWLSLSTSQESFDLCTRACVHEFVDRPEFIQAVEEWQRTIAEITNTIREARESDGDES